MTASGFLLFDKPAGRTSFAALGGFKNAFPGARIGHTGTLDNFATGLLVVVVGGYSHLSPWFVGLDKIYEAEIQFGLGTDTLDPSGAITQRGEVPALEALEASLAAFRGAIEQIPPEYSAIHVDGKRASALARKGVAVKLAPRRVTIHSLDLLSYENGAASIVVHCSSGTYIRALARDIAAACGTCAHVSALRRTKVGPFHVGDTISSPEEATIGYLHQLDPETALLLGLNVGFIPEESEVAFTNGAPFALPKIMSDLSRDGDIAIFSAGRKLLGVVERIGKGLNYKLVLPKEEVGR